MTGSPCFRKPRLYNLVGSLFVLGILCGGVQAQTPVQLPAPASVLPPAPVPVSTLILSLGKAREMALEHQPAMAAARASLAVAHTKLNALQNLGRLVNAIRHDLPVRQHQAELGVAGAEARLRQTEDETLFAVTRCYWAAVFAHTQVRLAEETLDEDVKKSKSLYKLKDILNKARLARDDVEKWPAEDVDTLILATKARREEARQGVHRALAALREAIGLENVCKIALVDEELPDIVSVPCCEQMVALALARRAELAQAGLLAEACALEAAAQDLINHGLRVETFAAGADLHAVPLSAPSFGDDYRPGPLGFEMPGVLVGNRCQRVEQAEALHKRSLSVVDKTRNLLRLEAENTYLQWVEARDKGVWYEQAAVNAEKISKAAIKSFLRVDPLTSKSKTSANDVVLSYQKRPALRVQANEARYKVVIYQAALERVTSGGYCPEYRPAPPRQDDKDDDDDKDKDGKDKEDKDKGENR